MNKNRVILTIVSLLFFLSLSAQNLTDPKEIIRKAEEKVRGVKSSYAEMTITIVRKKWSREMSMKSWSKGDDYSLILVTAPAKDKGTTTLKRFKEVWSWLPAVERTIKLPPSMMSQSWMGTDLTNDDLVRESSTIKDYSHRLMSDTTIAGRNCYKIEMIPKEDASVVWGKVIAMIDKQDFIQLRSEMYDEDDDLVNEMNSSAIKVLDGIKLATRMEFIPVDKPGQKTIMEFHTMKFDIDIADSFFSVQNMKKVR